MARKSKLTGRIDWYAPLFLKVSRIITYQVSHGISYDDEDAAGKVRKLSYDWDEDKNYNVTEEYIWILAKVKSSENQSILVSLKHCLAQKGNKWDKGYDGVDVVENGTIKNLLDPQKQITLRFEGNMVDDRIMEVETLWRKDSFRIRVVQAVSILFTIGITILCLVILARVSAAWYYSLIVIFVGYVVFYT